MAGLHTAAERMSNPNSQDTYPPNTIIEIASNQSQKQQTSNHSKIIVIDASEIENGSSGRAKGLVVPGFQVPLENLQENALHYYGDSSGWTVPYPHLYNPSVHHLV